MPIVLNGTTGINAGSLPVSNCGNTEVEGNLNLSGVGARITGDFSNATDSNRVSFQSSTTNGNTFVSAIPNGTATTSAIGSFNNQDTSNSSVGYLSTNASAVRIISARTGTGTDLPITFSTTGIERMRIDTAGNVGIGTSSPISKLNIFATGSTPTAIKQGAYNTISNTDSIFSVSENLGARGDGNSTFGGRFGASFRRSGTSGIISNTGLGYYAFGGQYGNDDTYQPTKNLYAASIVGMSEGAFTSATNMPTAISFRTGFVGESLDAPNTSYGTERMRIDASGNVLVTNVGGLGYGTGAGGQVTQLTNKSTAVTLNKPTGQIITSNSTLAAGATAAFILYNSLLTGNDNVKVIVGGAGAAGAYQADCTYCVNGATNITIKNLDAVSRSDNVAINFQVIKGATA